MIFLNLVNFKKLNNDRKLSFSPDQMNVIYYSAHLKEKSINDIIVIKKTGESNVWQNNKCSEIKFYFYTQIFKDLCKLSLFADFRIM